ncbi:T9SS type A sorting domain-containing protein [uncultured Imperialibacter sp.]|uniref:T9SS type A sorting domain-containing protein n=1 Tax=uncultured Imperialibacter sp. TaxID=1672639 RepID=UPI0030DD14C3|tara:strand:+ start:51346 stop:53730 length:2385 start_codon:yes stop_codon:yes gene_type:complete
MKNVLVYFTILSGIFTTAQGQSVINAYAKVTNVSGANLSLSNVNETYATFEAGEKVLIMQMQDNVIGSNTGNNANFGNISTIGSAGLYEEATIQSVTETAGASQTIWSETFEDQAYGTTTDNGITAWSLGCSGATPCGVPAGGGRSANVFDGSGAGYSRLIVGNNVSNPVKWTSEVLDISRYTNVSISMLLAQAGYDNGSDYVRAYYSIDGSGEQILTNGNRSGNFGAVSATAAGVSGSTLQLFVYIMNDATNDFGGFDNVLVTGTPGTPSSITLTSSLANTYNTGANSSLQIISFPEYVNYTTTANLTALPWDGNVGGVFAIDVNNTLTLANNISVNAQGFAGGLPNPTNDGTGCDAATYITNSNSYARKGESIYKVTSTNYRAARGKVANGGGGGNFHNAGGGGGGNYTTGGAGGPGWDGTTGGCTPTSGGLGGLDLSSYISASRVFMGGGGGGGQQNNGVSLTGGAGGGIIIIRASTIQTNGGCGGLSITANGASKGLTGNDGGAGAGAGGSIVFQVSNWSLSCAVATEAKGGNGSSVNDGNTHGGGGGGGKGVIIFSGTAPVTNFSTSNTQGTGGANGTNGGAGTAVAGGTTPSSATADADGVMESSPGVLPVELLNWNGKEVDNQVLLTWTTAAEKNNHYFTIERSSDAKNWEVFEIVEGAGTTDRKMYYDLMDEEPMPSTNYYRLSQTDYDGTTEVFEIVSVKLDLFETNLLLYPNPSNGLFKIKLPDVLLEADYAIQMFDVNGRAVETNISQEWGEVAVDATSLSTGYYFVKVAVGSYVQNIKVIID